MDVEGGKLKVKCIDISKKTILTINKSYIVYGGEFSLNKGVKKYKRLIIENDNGSLNPYDASSFDIIINIDDSYSVNNVDDDTFKFIHNKISYEYFWDMFYNDVNTAIMDFDFAKKELYIKELNKDEIKTKLISDNVDERDFISDMLIEYKKYDFTEDVIDFCNNELNKWIRNVPLESLFKYLSSFENSMVNEFFDKYLLETEKGHKNLDDITYAYFSK